MQKQDAQKGSQRGRKEFGHRDVQDEYVEASE
jgi:hypothetical protein